MIRKKIGYEERVVVLGHLQRGGSPCLWDRILGIRLGAAAVDAAVKKKRNIMIGIVNEKIKTSPLQDISKKKKINLNLYYLNRIMAT